MNKERIAKAEKNFKSYVDDGKIKIISEIKPIVYETYLKNANESLIVANMIFSQNISSLWVVVSSYYAMFYMASAYLYKLGFKMSHEICHQVTNEALIVQGRHKIKKHFLENYNEEKEKALEISDNHLENYEREKVKRASFQYQTTEAIKKSKAETSLNRAKEFIEILREILVSNP